MKNFIINILKRNTDESSKRFIAVYTMLLLTVLLGIYTNKDNIVIIADSLMLFILTLLGLGTFETVNALKNNKTNKNEQKINDDTP